MRRRILLAALTAALATAGCAGVGQLSSVVTSYSQWPAERAPTSFVFERLPSQEMAPDIRMIEDAARPALQRRGLQPAAPGQAADFAVQLGVRVTGNQRGFYDDPFWGPGFGRLGAGYWGRGFGLGLGFGIPSAVYEREVSVLIRDRRSGQPLYESHAVNDGASPSINSLLPALFDAALLDFPHGSGPRRVMTQIAR